MRLLVTRPEPDGERTAATLRERGHEVIVMPLMRTEPIDADLGAGPWSAVLVTSANACRAIAERAEMANLASLPVFAVGRRTAQAARVAGFADVTSATGDGKALAAAVAEGVVDRARPLLYLAGEERAADLENLLAAQGFSIHAAVVYRMVAESAFSASVRTALEQGDIDAALHFSARSAGACLAAAEAAGVLHNILKIRHYCLSAGIASALAAAAACDLVVAAEPSESALLDGIGEA
jgi:uroporphyrinogen-III synthase